MVSASTLPPPAGSPRRPATVLAVLAAWAIAVPWIAEAAGLRLDVSTKLEVIDHVVPGLLALACAALLVYVADQSPSSLGRLGAVAVAFLAGVWITTTHIALIPDAIDGSVRWGAAVLHISGGPPVLLFGLWNLLGPPAR